MAGYNPAAFYNPIFSEAAQVRQENRENQKQILDSLGSISKTVPDAYQQYQTQKMAQEAIDEDGNFDQNAFVKALAQKDPLKAYQLQTEFNKNQLANTQVQANIDRINADAARIQAVQGGQAITNDLTRQKISTEQANTYKVNLDNQTKGINQLYSMLSTANTQGEYDSMINTARRMGLPEQYIDQFAGRKFTPELKDEVGNFLNSSLDYVEQARKNLDTQYDIQNVQSQIQSRDNNQVLEAAKYQNQLEQQDSTNAFKERQLANSEKSTQAQIDNNNIQRQQTVNKSSKENQEKLAEVEQNYQNNASVSNDSISLINNILNSPVFDSMAGGGLLSQAKSMVPNSQWANFQADLDTLQSQSFLQNIKGMKGLGALSDAEGKKINAAMGTINYNVTSDKLRSTLQNILQRFNNFKNEDAKYYNNLSKTYGGNNSQQNNYSAPLTNSSNNANISMPTSNNSQNSLQSKFELWKSQGIK